MLLIGFLLADVEANQDRLLPRFPRPGFVLQPNKRHHLLGLPSWSRSSQMRRSHNHRSNHTNQDLHRVRLTARFSNLASILDISWTLISISIVFVLLSGTLTTTVSWRMWIDSVLVVCDIWFWCWALRNMERLPVWLQASIRNSPGWKLFVEQGHQPIVLLLRHWLL